MSDKYQEYKDQIYEEFFSRPATVYRSLTQAYTKLNKVQRFLELSSLSLWAEFVEEAKRDLDKVGKRWREVILEEDMAALQRTVNEYFPDPRS
mgnify:CR=1 FL=1